MNKQQLEFIIFYIEKLIEQCKISSKLAYNLALKEIDINNIKCFEIEKEQHIKKISIGNLSIDDEKRIVLQILYRNIIIEFSNQTGKSIEESLKYFYYSNIYKLIRNGVGDIHCRGVKYLVDELMLEYGFKHHISYPKELVHELI